MTTKIDLTAFSQGGLASETLAYLERDRWPELERELRLRRPRKLHFLTSSMMDERQRWEWLVCRCRSWSEVERVLNANKVNWDRIDRGAVRTWSGMLIYRNRR